jgi:hypothetical protein
MEANHGSFCGKGEARHVDGRSFISAKRFAPVLTNSRRGTPSGQTGHVPATVSLILCGLQELR